VGLLDKFFNSRLAFGPILAVLLMVVSLAMGFALAQDFNSTVSAGSSWVNPIVSSEEVRALPWVRANTAHRERFMACIFEGEFLMGHTLRESMEGGDWAIVPDVVRQMGDVNDFFTTNESFKAWQIASKYNATHAWVPLRDQFCGFSWERASMKKFSDTRYFEEAFSNEKVKIYRILPQSSSLSAPTVKPAGSRGSG